MASVAVVEFHGFKDNSNRFIVKELAVVGSDFRLSILFKSPYEFNKLNVATRKSNRWLVHNFHKILWEEGSVRFSFSFMRTLLRPFDVVYTKGHEKQQFLGKLHKDVRNLNESWSVPKTFNMSSFSCCLKQHVNSCNVKCALKSAVYYFEKTISNINESALN